MRRSVRNGLAVAGIAGGLWFLGNAVANADATTPNTTQTATAVNNADQNTNSDDSAGSNSNGTSADAKNVNVNKTETDVAGGNATNNAGVNTGQKNPVLMVVTPVITPALGTTPQQEGDKKGTEENLTTGNVNGSQNSAGGNVASSGNVAKNTGPVTQNASATNNVKQTTESDEEDSNSSGNSNSSDADAKNVNVDKTETNVSGGDATNNAFINTGLIGVTFNCPQGATCIYNIHTGDVTLVQNAKGGDVSCSGNVGVNAVCPAAAAPQAKPAVQKVAVHKVAAHPVVLSAAQPTAVLATTGAEWGLPLTVGLIALTAGTGLTLAGRRRETATV
jgi:hypothetical protein